MTKLCQILTFNATFDYPISLIKADIFTAEGVYNLNMSYMTSHTVFFYTRVLNFAIPAFRVKYHKREKFAKYGLTTSLILMARFSYIQRCMFKECLNTNFYIRTVYISTENKEKFMTYIYYKLIPKESTKTFVVYS